MTGVLIRLDPVSRVSFNIKLSQYVIAEITESYNQIRQRTLAKLLDNLAVFAALILQIGSRANAIPCAFT